MFYSNYFCVNMLLFYDPVVVNMDTTTHFCINVIFFYDPMVVNMDTNTHSCVNINLFYDPMLVNMDQMTRIHALLLNKSNDVNSRTFIE